MSKFMRISAEADPDAELRYTSNIYYIYISDAIKNQQSELVTVCAPDDLKMRPIIAGPASPTHRLSHFLDILMRPLIKGVQAYVRDTSRHPIKAPRDCSR